MNVKEFKEYLKIFDDNDLIVEVFQDYLKRFGTNTECEINKIKEWLKNDK